jgi:predicted RNA-binding Zn-ribbon protein involved in translation (DUF1610 family)
MLSSKKVANNILDFLIDPTRVPVKERVYFRDEEILKNESYEKAKADACAAFKDQKHNSDFYPHKNRSLNREALIMDRKTLIASLDVLSKNFQNPSDPIAADLSMMAQALSKMSDEELTPRLASEAPDLETVLAADTFPCPKCGTKVLSKTKYCVKCKAKVAPKEASEEVTAGGLTFEKIQMALKGLSLQEAKAVAQAYKENKGKKVASEEVIAKLGLSGKALIVFAALMALAQGAKAGTADNLAKDLSSASMKEDIVNLELPKEDFSLPVITDASRIQGQFEASKDVPTEMSGPSHPMAPSDSVKIRDASEDFWTKEASDVVAQALVSEIVGIVADDDKDDDDKKEKKEVPAVAPAPVEAKKEEEKKPEIPAPAKKEELAPVMAVEKKPEEKKIEEKKPEEVVPPEPGTKEAVVDTGILASVTFAGIEVPTGIMSMDDVGEMSDQEKANLARLF